MQTPPSAFRNYDLKAKVLNDMFLYNEFIFATLEFNKQQELWDKASINADIR